MSTIINERLNLDKSSHQAQRQNNERKDETYVPFQREEVLRKKHFQMRSVYHLYFI